MITHGFLALVLGLATLHSDSEEPVSARIELESPARPGSGEPRLHSGDDGALYLSWIEREGSLARLCFSRLDEESRTWSEAKTIASGEDWFVNWADTPALCVLADGTMAAHWLRRTSAKTYAYEIRTSLSTDGGESWSAGARLHDDDREAEHGFVSWVSLGDRFGVLWLGGPPLDEEGGRFSLLYRELDRDGTLGPEVRLDDDTCTCCPTSLAKTEAGELWAVYRDRSPAEVRDIYSVRRSEAGWSKPTPVFDDGWVMPGCPVNGPVLAARGPHLATAWYTGAGTDGGRVNLAFARGESFSFPTRVDGGTPEGRPCLALLENGTALVAWLEVVGTSAEWQLRRVTAGRTHAEQQLDAPVSTIATVPHSRSSGFAQLAAREGALVFAWTEPDSPSRVRTRLLELRD